MAFLSSLLVCNRFSGAYTNGEGPLLTGGYFDVRLEADISNKLAVLSSHKVFFFG